MKFLINFKKAITLLPSNPSHPLTAVPSESEVRDSGPLLLLGLILSSISCCTSWAEELFTPGSVPLVISHSLPSHVIDNSGHPLVPDAFKSNNTAIAPYEFFKCLLESEKSAEIILLPSLTKLTFPAVL